MGEIPIFGPSGLPKASSEDEGFQPSKSKKSRSRRMELEELFSGQRVENDRRASWGLIPKNLDAYQTAHHLSVTRREAFWERTAERLSWERPFHQAVVEDLASGEVEWFLGGKINAFRNVVRIHLEHGFWERTAVIFTSDEDGTETLDYRTLEQEVTKIAVVLRARGLGIGDRVALHMPDGKESFLLMLACARLGITYIPVYWRFPAEVAIRQIEDSGASLLVVSDRNASSDEKNQTLKLLSMIPDELECVYCGGDPPVDMAKLTALPQDATCPTFATEVKVDSESHIFLLYGGAPVSPPRGYAFSTGGFLVHAAQSFEAFFKACMAPDEPRALRCCVPLATAAGQCYGIWGPMLNGCIPIIGDYTHASTRRKKEIPADARPFSLLCNPELLQGTAKAGGTDPGPGSEISCLKESGGPALVACCGEMLSPRYVHETASYLSIPEHAIINLWTKTAVGAALVGTYPHPALNRPGALGLPALGVMPQVKNPRGELCQPNESGQLCMASSWPAMIRTIWGQRERFRQLYFPRTPGGFTTRDGVRQDSEGYFWFMRRLSDVVNLSGQSLPTAEMEMILSAHPEIEEAAVVGVPAADGGDSLVLFVAVRSGSADILTNDVRRHMIRDEIIEHLRGQMGELASPLRIVFAKELPRTPSGKLVRGLLRRIAEGSIDEKEDLSHVANPDAMKELMEQGKHGE